MGHLDKTVLKLVHVKMVVRAIQWMEPVHAHWNIQGKTVKSVSYMSVSLAVKLIFQYMLLGLYSDDRRAYPLSVAMVILY